MDTTHGRKASAAALRRALDTADTDLTAALEAARALDDDAEAVAAIIAADRAHRAAYVAASRAYTAALEGK